jgi:hypothetical protein
MVYGMVKAWTVLVLMMIVIVSAGCLDTLMGKPENKPQTLPPTTLPTTENPSSTVQPSDMALQLADLPSDYILRDRSVMVSPEVAQLTRDLGWREGYFVAFYRIDKDKDDLTRIRQSINFFPIENMKKVFDLEKIDLESQAISPQIQSEIPFPVTGDYSRAYRLTDPTDATKQVTYTVIFTKKNVYEKIVMTGTTTDYEVLKDVVQKAAAKIH